MGGLWEGCGRAVGGLWELWEASPASPNPAWPNPDSYLLPALVAEKRTVEKLGKIGMGTGPGPLLRTLHKLGSHRILFDVTNDVSHTVVWTHLVIIVSLLPFNLIASLPGRISHVATKLMQGAIQGVAMAQ